MTHILIVCTANICRSPVAEALLKDRLAGAGYPDWQVSSAGTWAMRGQLASQYSTQLMAEHGLDISDHKSRPVSTRLLDEADLVLCMEKGHVEALKVEFPGFADRIYLLTEMAGQRHSVSDPYGGPRHHYERMVDEVEKLIEDGLPMIIELAEATSGERTKPEA